jgi:phosphoglycerate dehydrogenase-like enzyme
VLTSPGWQKQLHRADLCFITLPLTRETTGLFDERVLRKLPPHAILVNAGRRKIVDTEALIRVLNAGHLAGAAFDETGIPPSDPLRSAPRLLITPKTSTFVPGRQPRLELFIEDQVRRYLNGETLHYPFPLHPENLEVCT